MYCLTYPQDSELPPIQAPYVANLHCDVTIPRNFEEFAARNGFSKEELSSKPNDELASFLQSWLFFGLTSAILEKNVNPIDLISPPSDETDVTRGFIDIRVDSPIHQLVLERHSSLDEMDGEGKEAIEEHIKGCIFYAGRWLLHFEHIDEPTGSVLASVVLSIQLLLEVLGVYFLSFMMVITAHERKLTMSYLNGY
jgi:hypothetical protein